VLVRSLLQQHECVFVLDAEVELFGSLADLAELADRRGIVLVPSVLEPVPLDGFAPTEPDLQALGIYNSGCLALGRVAGGFLDWHAAHLRARSERDIPGGASLDDRWLDFVPAYFDHRVVRDPGLGVGSWNLHERQVEIRSGQYFVNGHPLRLFNFRGFDPDRPDTPTTHRFRSDLPLRTDPGEQPAVVRLRSAYAEALRA